MISELKLVRSFSLGSMFESGVGVVEEGGRCLNGSIDAVGRYDELSRALAFVIVQGHDLRGLDNSSLTLVSTQREESREVVDPFGQVLARRFAELVVRGDQIKDVVA